MKYTVKENYLDLVKGETVYDLRMHDYGCRRDDESMLQVPCTSVTRDPNGGYPFIITPSSNLITIND